MRYSSKPGWLSPVWMPGFPALSYACPNHQAPRFPLVPGLVRGEGRGDGLRGSRADFPAAGRHFWGDVD